MNGRWFISPSYRRASDLCAQVEKLRRAQADLLEPAAMETLTAALAATKAAMAEGVPSDRLDKETAALEQVAEQYFKPYPNAEWRDNIEVFLVAIVVAMAIRTFFAQPFKIPTGSMQPTLFGVTVQDLRAERDFKMPGFFGRIYEFAVHGAIYHQVIATDEGEFDHADEIQHVNKIFTKQTIWVRYRNGPQTPVTIWLAPEPSQIESFEHRVGLVVSHDEDYAIRRTFHKGEPIMQFVEFTGDHLFVDRFTYNFRPPRRGEIVVFRTKDIPQIGQDQFYIKRLIGLPGDTISIGRDRHVSINGERLDDKTPHFEKVYGFDTNRPPRESRQLTDQFYSGHTLARGFESRLRTTFDRLKVRPEHYAVFGDNTVDSLDSRYWGDFPQSNVIGKGFFVYWPITSMGTVPSRFGFVRH